MGSEHKHGIQERIQHNRETGNTSKTDYKQSDRIYLSHCPMRPVPRGSNPNKETLIYIPLSHATVIQAYIIRVAKSYDGPEREYITDTIINPKQERVIVNTGIITGITEIIISITSWEHNWKRAWTIKNHNAIHNSINYYYYYSSNSYIQVCVSVSIPTHIHPYIRKSRVVIGSRWRTDNTSYSSFHTPGTGLEAQSPPNSHIMWAQGPTNSNLPCITHLL